MIYRVRRVSGDRDDIFFFPLAAAAIVSVVNNGVGLREINPSVLAIYVYDFLFFFHDFIHVYISRNVEMRPPGTAHFVLRRVPRPSRTRQNRQIRLNVRA